MTEPKSDIWQEVAGVLDSLYTPDEAALWMTLPNLFLADRAPRDCDPADVLRMLRLFLEGTYL